jgi:capsular exopolysaccharide synthesis family protein
MEFGANPTLRSYLVVLRRRKWWIAWAAMAGLAVSLALSLTQAKQYSATAQLLVQPSGQASVSGAQQSVTPTEVQTDLQLVTSAPVQELVLRRLGSHPPVSSFQVAQTNVISITAIAATPSRAARIANTYAQAFVTYQRTVVIDNATAAEAQLRSQIQSVGAEAQSLRGHAGAAPDVTALLNQEAVLREQLAQLQVNGAVAPGGVATGGVEVVTPAQAPSSPSSPKPTQDALLGLLAGLMLGLGAAFLRHNLDDRVTSKEAAEHFGGSPVLGLVPMVTSWKRRKQAMVVSTAKPMSPAAESYRSLRTSLQFARQGRDLRTLLVTSPAASEGKTSTLANLGAVFAQAGERVVLVSGDLRRPRIGQFFGLDEAVGLTNVLLGDRSLKQALQPAGERLWLLAAGLVPANPAELLSGRGVRDVFAALGEDFDLVLIDSPPVLPVTDAMVLSNYANGTLLVVAAGQTRQAELERAAEKFAQAKAPLVGIVLNEVTKQSGYGRYGTGYGYGSYAAATPVAGGPVPDGPVPDGPVPDGPVPDGPVPDGTVHPNGDSATASTMARHGRPRQ